MSVSCHKDADARTQESMSRAAELVHRIKTGQPGSSSLARLEAILAKVEQARQELEMLIPDPGWSPEAINDLQAVERTLAEAPSAGLRAFLFQTAEKQARAYTEIERRVSILYDITKELGEPNESHQTI